MATLRISLTKKLPRSINLLNGSRLYYKTITCEKNSAFFSVLQGNCAVASPKEQLNEQMTSNPAFTERNIQKANAYLLYSRQEQKSLVSYHTLQSLYVCVWLVNTLTSTAPIGSPIICMWSPADICEQWEFIFRFSRRLWGCVRGYRIPFGLLKPQYRILKKKLPQNRTKNHPI